MKLEDVFLIKLKARYMVKVFFVRKVDQFDSYGEFNPTTKEIKILDDMEYDEKLHTFIHEVIHAIDDCYDIKLSETGTEKFTKAILKIFELNPDLKKLMVNI